MRTIERTAGFKRDYKREAKGAHRATLDTDLTAVIKALALDQPLAERYRDHPLTDSVINGSQRLGPVPQPFANSSPG
jgi:mRNA-degrading endonuclease YafQ of YafQ-DinJ toxin-antitoxin module